MKSILHQRAAESCVLLFGVALSTLLAPIHPAAPAGTSLRTNGVYQTIAQARMADDASLPMGTWQRELKSADWDRVSKMAVSALSDQGKDLQVAAWLLEAQINQNGFAGLAASLHLIEQLCRNYWDALFPGAHGDGLAHRANIFRWINEKLLPALRQAPLTGAASGPRHGYADWERARRHDQLRLEPGQKEGATSAELAAAVGATPTEFYVAMERDLDAALGALDELAQTIAPHFGAQAPSLAGFGGVLKQIRALVLAELHERGVRAPVPDAAHAHAPDAVMAPPPAIDAGPIRDREHAYAVLALAADFLLRTDQHSPVPYMIRRAVEWGQLNAGQLYQELFIRLGGQLNIFADVMRLDAPAGQEEH